MLFVNFISKLSGVIGILCGCWLLGLGIFTIVKKIILKVRARKEIKNIIDEEKE